MILFDLSTGFSNILNYSPIQISHEIINNGNVYHPCFTSSIVIVYQTITLPVFRLHIYRVYSTPVSPNLVRFLSRVTCL